MKRTLDVNITFLGNDYEPMDVTLSPDPLGFNDYIYQIPYNGKTYTVIVSVQKNRNCFAAIVKDEIITLRQFHQATNIAPPNYALGLPVDDDEVDESVADLIVNYRRHTLLSFGGIQKMMETSINNGGHGEFLFSEIFK